MTHNLRICYYLTDSDCIAILLHINSFSCLLQFLFNLFLIHFLSILWQMITIMYIHLYCQRTTLTYGKNIWLITTHWLRNRQDGSAISRLRNRQELMVLQPQNTGTVLTVPLFYGYGTVNSRFINSFTRWRHIT